MQLGSDDPPRRFVALSSSKHRGLHFLHLIRMRNLVCVIGRSFISSRSLLLFHLPQVRVLSRKSCLTSVPAGYFLMISTWFSSTSEFPTALYKQLATQSSPNEEESKDDNFDQILAAIQKAPKSSEDICVSNIDKLCRAGNLHAAAGFLQFLHDKNVRIGFRAFNRLLVAAGERSNIEVLCRIFRDLVVSVESLPSACYLSFARGFVKLSDCACLLRLVKEVWEELTSPSSTMVVNRIIFAFGESRQLDKALSIFYWMQDMKYGPDLVTYNTVLEILGRAGQVDEMLHEFASMKEVGIVPDFISYNTILNQLRKVGRLDLCLVHYKDMVVSGIKPDLLTYTALIESLGRAGNIEEALKLFSEMKNRKIRPSIYIYRSLIKNLKKVGDMELASRMSVEMNASISNLAGPKDFKKKGR